MLSFKERVLFKLAFYLNKYFGRPLIFYRHLLANIYFSVWGNKNAIFHGLKNIGDLDENKTVVLLANHRSFIDFYLVSAALSKYASVSKRKYFPVRSNFFYDRIVGFAINFFAAGLSMFPPVFRDRKKRLFNEYSVSMAVNMLSNSDLPVVLGMHPEGARNKNADPYSFLKAKPGIGEILMQVTSNVIVIPVFIYMREEDSASNQYGSINKGLHPKFSVSFGPSIDFDDYRSKNKNLKLYLEVSNYCMAAIKELAYAHRETNVDTQI